MGTVLRAALWIGGDAVYLVVLWVVYGVFFPGGTIVAAGLMFRYLSIWLVSRRHPAVFAVTIFATSLALYMLPFYVSDAAVLVGVRSGEFGSLSTHWAIGAGSALAAVLGLVLARMFVARLTGRKR